MNLICCLQVRLPSKAKRRSEHRAFGQMSRRQVKTSLSVHRYSNHDILLERRAPVRQTTIRPTFAKEVSSNLVLVPEGIILAPPKVSFASASRNQNKSSEGGDRAQAPTQEAQAESGDRSNIREKFFKERDSGRRNGAVNGRRSGAKEEAEGWTNVRARRSQGDDEGEKVVREADRDKDRSSRDMDTDFGTDSGARKIEAGRGRFDQPWSRDDGSNSKESAIRRQGWRERERERRDEKDWTRSSRVEAEPEWMDSPANDDKKQAHTQEEFQRWKERMKAGTAASEDKSDPAADSTPGTKKTTASSIPPTPLAKDGGFDQLVGIWGENKRTEGGTESGQPPRPHGAKSKGSKFAGFFVAKEEPVHINTGNDPRCPRQPWCEWFKGRQRGVSAYTADARRHEHCTAPCAATIICLAS